MKGSPGALLVLIVLTLVASSQSQNCSELDQVPASDENDTCVECYVRDEALPVYSSNDTCISCADSDEATPVWDSNSTSCISCPDG